MPRLFDNLGLKLASLLIALTLWFLVAGEKTSEIGLSVSVELQNVPKNLEVVGHAADRVEVRLRATPAIVHQLDQKDVSVRIDLNGFEEGEHFFNLTEALVRRPFGVTVVKLSPASLTLSLERTLEREVPIAARVAGTPAPGFEIAEIVAEPPTVRVAGPRSRVAGLKNAFTEAVSVEGLSESVSEEVNIGVGDPLVRIQGSPRVKVTVRLRERRELRTLSQLPLDVRGGAARVRPARVEVTIEGPYSLMSRVSPQTVRPYADVSGAAPGATVPVSIQMAPGFAGLAVQRIEPREVRTLSQAQRE